MDIPREPYDARKMLNLKENHPSDSMDYRGSLSD